MVATTIAQALGVTEVAGQSPANLASYLRKRHLLLLLDNFEHLISAAPLVADLLQAAPRLSMLITSRRVLQLYGEHEFAVPPLTLPDLKRLPPIEQLSDYEAVALFVLRIQTIDPGFAITSANAPVVAAICARLEGLPLSIELAAARGKLLDPQGLLARLGDRLGLLIWGPRHIPARQQTLRNTLDWSYNLLDVPTQAAFTQLAVFMGGCTLEAAEAVCQTERAFDEEQRTKRGWSLATSPPIQAALPPELHASVLLGGGWLARQQGDLAQAVAQLEASLAIWRRLRNSGGVALVLGYLGVVAYDRSEFVRATLLHEESLRLRQGTGDQWGIAVTLTNLSEVARQQGDQERALALQTQSLALFRTIGDTVGAATALLNTGLLHSQRGEHDRARALLNESLLLWQKLGEQVYLAESLEGLASVAAAQSEAARAARIGGARQRSARQSAHRYRRPTAHATSRRWIQRAHRSTRQPSPPHGRQARRSHWSKPSPMRCANNSLERKSISALTEQAASRARSLPASRRHL